MKVEETLRRLDMDGFCILQGVIPEDEVHEVQG